MTKDFNKKEIPVSKRKEFMGKGFFVAILVLIQIGLGLAVVDSCFKDAEKTAEVIQQAKADGEMVEIDGMSFKRTTFYDEGNACWKIYTGGLRGNSSFAIPCPKE